MLPSLLCFSLLAVLTILFAGDGGEQEVRLLRLPKKHLLRRSGALANMPVLLTSVHIYRIHTGTYRCGEGGERPLFDFCLELWSYEREGAGEIERG